MRTSVVVARSGSQAEQVADQPAAVLMISGFFASIAPGCGPWRAPAADHAAMRSTRHAQRHQHATQATPLNAGRRRSASASAAAGAEGTRPAAPEATQHSLHPRPARA